MCTQCLHYEILYDGSRASRSDSVAMSLSIAHVCRYCRFCICIDSGIDVLALSPLSCAVSVGESRSYFGHLPRTAFEALLDCLPPLASFSEVGCCSSKAELH